MGNKLVLLGCKDTKVGIEQYMMGRVVSEDNLDITLESPIKVNMVLNQTQQGTSIVNLYVTDEFFTEGQTTYDKDLFRSRRDIADTENLVKVYEQQLSTYRASKAGLLLPKDQGLQSVSPGVN